MAYYHRHNHETPGNVFCDECAENGTTPVSFKLESDGFMHQEHPWCSAPLWGGLPSVTQEECDKVGITEHRRLGLCDRCKRRC